MITGPGSYPATLDEFLAHWAMVNADPAAGTGLVTRDGADRPDLVTLRANLEEATNEVADRLNGKEIDRARVENAKKALLARSQELGRRLRGVLPEDSPFLKAVPEMPLQTSSQQVFLKPVRDLANLWDRVNTEGPVVTLTEAYTAALYRTDFEALGTLYGTLSESELDLKLEREKRNKLQTEAREILSAYRPAVLGLFPPDSPLVLTLPLIYPPDGHTPAAVTATATYDAAAHEAVITFTESAEATLESYQVRGVAGPEYDAENEVVLATLPKDAPREFRTDFSLSEAGTAASFKVYVVLTTGNVAGSHAVTVERP